MVKRKIVQIDEEKCDGCGLCVPACEEGAIEIIDGKARLVEDKLCDGLGDCLGECPQDAIQIIEREAENFDEEAVKERLEELRKEKAKKEQQAPVGGGCPGSRIMQINKKIDTKEDNSKEASSELEQWPVQLHLVSPHAPYFEDSDLLVAADCVPVAYPEFHRKLLKGKSVAIGCPKLDEADAYIEKLAQIFTVNDIKSVTVAIMEVPCCSGLLSIVNKAIEMSGTDLEINQQVIGVNGEKK
ncbi:4Fe-4S binding protein [Natranaerobius trueperi]|uniref:4Fe-4S ferredoxin n=1 Tax=Natranaerobius trueperi TaxID=759412 RepID=A0A226C355_9FIRM|nr:4Fe-4S binding protein [Natranaerobius trueperi]OWZ84889.1 4Fe-4S ferredoxin [Natranaerobius trueperi]